MAEAGGTQTPDITTKAAPANSPPKDPMDEKAAMAKEILERSILAKKGGNRQDDPRVQQAQQILSGNRGQAAQSSTPDFNQDLASFPQQDIASKLPSSHRQMLRQYYQDSMSGEWAPYFVGSLKSYSSKSGYGFLDCPQSHKLWGVDVFIHKNQVPVPWALGQAVEFAVVINQRQQPQAADCLWLPRLPQNQMQRNTPKPFGAQAGYNAPSGGPQPGVFSPSSPIAGIGAANGAPRQEAPKPAPSPAAAALPDEGPATAEGTRRNPSEGPFYLGTLKSFSSAQGYGFVACEDVFKLYQRDIYFDRSQLPRPPIYTQGQTLEFQVNLNARGQPQARNLIWDCVPLLPSEDVPTAPSNKHSPQSLDKLRKLLRLLNDVDKEAAVVTAIDVQGGTEKAAADQAHVDNAMPDVDYVTYVLDRLGVETAAVMNIKDFVKMLLLLMLAKMLKKRFDAVRIEKLTRWLVLLAGAIDPSTEKQVQDHFLDVVSQIESNLRQALTDNPNTQEPQTLALINGVLQQLKDKAGAAKVG